MNPQNYHQVIEDQFINAGRHIFDYATNNSGLFYQFEKNQIQEAMYYYQEAEKHDFALALVNLGYIYENQKIDYISSDDDNLKKAINYYMRASEYEDLPLKIKSKLIYDEYYEISKIFIICFINLKLTDYFIKKVDYLQALNYFKRAFSKLIDDKNVFNFEINQNEIQNENAFQYLRHFILNFSGFNLNLNNKPQNNYSTSKLPLLNKNNSVKLKSIKVNEIERKIVFKDPESVFRFATRNQKTKNILMDEINHIIKEMNQILYKPPYLILYGRMNSTPIYQLPPMSSNKSVNPRTRYRAIPVKNNPSFNSGFNE